MLLCGHLTNKWQIPSLFYYGQQILVPCHHPTGGPLARRSGIARAPAHVAAAIEHC